MKKISLGIVKFMNFKVILPELIEKSFQFFSGYVMYKGEYTFISILKSILKI